MSKSNQPVLDIAKGLAIIALILGSTLYLPEGLGKWLYTFHLPLLFLLSGSLFSTENSFRSLLAKTSKLLLLPYLIFSLFAYGWWYVGWRDGGHSGTGWSELLTGVLFGTRNADWSVPSDMLWFFPCLFAVHIIFYGIRKWSKSMVHLLFGLLLCAVAGSVYNVWIGQPLFLSIDAALMAVPFFGLGFILRQASEGVQMYASNTVILLFLLVLNLVPGLINAPIDMSANEYGSPLYFYLAAIGGSLFIYLISNWIRRNKTLEQLGGNALLLLAIHPYLLAFLRNWLESAGSIQGLPAALLLTAACLLLSVPIIYIFRYVLRVLSGEKRQAVSQ